MTQSTPEQPRKDPAEPAKETVVEASPVPAPVIAEQPQPQKPQTLEEYVAAAPEELQTILNESVKIHNDRKAVVINALKETKRCDVPDDELNSMTLSKLEQLAKLAGLGEAKEESLTETADFSARSTPSPTVAAADDTSVPMPAPIFGPKKAAA